MTETDETVNDETDRNEETPEQPSADQKYPEIHLMEKVVVDHGEVHAVLDEADSFDRGSELEIRRGPSEFSYEHETIIIEGADTSHFIPMDSVVRFYIPNQVSH